MNAKIGFEQIKGNVYLLRVPFRSTFVGITLINGDSKDKRMLIDSGPNAETVEDMLIPALSELGLRLTDIGAVTLTHCHCDNIGGLATIVRHSPDITVIAVSTEMAKRIQNPMRYLIGEHRALKNDAPSLEEVHGVFVSRTLSNGDEFQGMKAVLSPGHSPDSVCWLHTDTGMLVCGDALQGFGNSFQGLADIVSVDDYLSTLDMLKVLDGVEGAVCSHDMDEMEPFVLRCEDVVDEIEQSERAIEEYIRKITELSDELDDREATQALLKEYGKEDVDTLAYSMLTVKAISEHIGKVWSDKYKSDFELDE